MARRVRDQSLDSRDARSKLKARGKPYWRTIGKGLHIGYRKGQTGGVWAVRRYIGNQQYEVETFAIADDFEDANGDTILDFWQAQEKARGKRTYRGPYRVWDAIDDYLKALEGRGAHYDRRLQAEHHILPCLGDELIDELTAAKIRAWHLKLSTMAPLIPGTKGAMRRVVDLTDPDQARKRKVSANRCLSILKAALNRSFKEGHAASDSEWRRVDAFPKVERARNRYLSFAEAERLLKACDPEFRVLVRGALETGMRYGELARLKVADFNPDAGVIGIKFSKSGNERHVILGADGRRFFEQLVAGRAGGDPMFGKRWGPTQQVRHMVTACGRAKIEPHVGFHQLRHTWASHAVMAGMPLAVVARNLGHVDTRMVEKHYGHLAPSYVSEQVRKFAPRFGNVGSL